MNKAIGRGRKVYDHDKDTAAERFTKDTATKTGMSETRHGSIGNGRE